MTPTNNPPRFSARIWVLIPIGALGFLLWINLVRIRQVEYVSGIGESTESIPANEAPAPSRPAAWQPRLIVPEHLNASYEWLDQTRQMFARREWRVRHIDYENAPFGREVYAPSPYRWWLGLVAWCDRAVSGRSPDQAVERAALVADPLLHLLLLTGTVIFVAWQFGAFPAALLSVGLAAMFPFTTEFLPGVPGDRGLAQLFALWSVLPLLAGTRALYSPVADASRRARRWFFAGGICGGLGLWINVSNAVPVLAGIGLGALIAAWVARGSVKIEGVIPGATGRTPWRPWAFGGAGTILAAYLVEYYPAHLGFWELREIHPLYGVAWVGGAELLARAVEWIQSRRPGRSVRDFAVVLCALAAAVALPVVMWRTHNQGFLNDDPSLFRLTRLSGGAVATSFWAWLIREGITPTVWATALPLLLIGPAAWLLLTRAAGLASRTGIALALGPVAVAIGFACRQLSWWNGLDVLLLALLVAVTTALSGIKNSRVVRWTWSGFAALLLLPGAVHLIQQANAGPKDALNERDIFGLVERDLARWMAQHVKVGEAVVLSPHNQAATLYHFGGLRGLATLDWENRDGLAAAVRILSASTPEEAKELIYRRGITHIVIPSWDSYLDIYTQMGMGRIEGTFMNLIHLWKLPPWLRPVAYQLPTIAGFEGQSVIILEVVDDQEDAVSLSRLTEYFVEMGQLDLAAAAGQALRRFPADLGALVARAQVEIGRGETAAFTRSVELMQPRLTGVGERGLLWDRRVSLAVVLARAKQTDLARIQVQRCLADVDEAKLRALSTGSLYRLQVLAKAFGLTITEPQLHDLALDLLPGDLRSRL